MPSFSKRLLHKLVRETASFIDSYSLYFNAPPKSSRISRLSEFSHLGEDVHIAGTVSVPTPSFLEIGSNVRLRSLKVAPCKHVLIERDVTSEDVVCSRPSILTKNRTYDGQESSGRQITLSVDMEGGVALSHAGQATWDHLSRFWDTRKSVERLAGLFKRYELPVTWAICGHLFLRHRDGDHGILESDWFGDWFLHDPATNHLENCSWYMPEQVQRLVEEPLFEIGYHSFGHFFYQTCSQHTVRRDIQFADQIRKGWGLDLETFVFPYNRAGHFDILSTQGGFRNFRGNIGRLYPAYGHLDFSHFRFFHTTQMFAPDTMELCTLQLPRLHGHAFNYYTHCYQWVEKDGWGALEYWLKSLAQKRDQGNLSICCIKDIDRGLPETRRMIE